MSDNLKIWNELKSVPAAAKKIIGGGRLKGMTDIKPQWRLQMMSEQFGPIGIGWYYKPIRTWKEDYVDQVSVYIEIELFIRITEPGIHPVEWSAPISGVGGSFLVAKERTGPFHSDEAYKMATTDALSVAMKELGVAADIYMGLSDSKYDKPVENVSQSHSKPTETKQNTKLMTSIQKSTLKDQIVKLEGIGSESANKAITAINTLLGHEIVSYVDALHLINRVKFTIDKVGNNA